MLNVFPQSCSIMQRRISRNRFLRCHFTIGAVFVFCIICAVRYGAYISPKNTCISVHCTVFHVSAAENDSASANDITVQKIGDVAILSDSLRKAAAKSAAVNQSTEDFNEIENELLYLSELAPNTEDPLVAFSRQVLAFRKKIHSRSMLTDAENVAGLEVLQLLQSIDRTENLESPETNESRISGEFRANPFFAGFPVPALPLKLSLESWLPDWSLLTSSDTVEQLPSLFYYIAVLFIQESIVLNPTELFLPLPPPTTPPQTESPTLEDITIVTAPGLGHLSNKYVFDIVSFKGKAYASTLNLGTRAGLDLFFLGLPFSSDGAEIWRGEPFGGPEGTWNWVNVVEGGLESSLNGGVRNMIVYGDYIYAVTLNHFIGFELWRSQDGINWIAVVKFGLGNRFNTSGRGLGVYQTYLYVGVENRATGAQLWRRKVDSNGNWEPGFEWEVIAHGSSGGGLLTNFWFSDFVEFNGSFYVSTMNFLGFEIWKLTHDPTPTDVTFERVFKADPALHGRGVAKMIVWQGTLLVGTMFRIPGGAVLLSSTDGTNFETHLPPTDIPGTSGEKSFIYLWTMMEYNGRVFVAANEWPSRRQGFVLFSFASLDDEWTVESGTGFGYAPLYYGIRSMAEFNGALLLGSASSEPAVIFSASAKTP